MTTRDDIRDVFSDELRAVRWRDERTAAIWYGGTTIRIVDFGPDGAPYEMQSFSISDSEGRPVDRDAAVEHMEGILGLSD